MTDPFETGSVKREKKLAFTNNVAISRHFAYAYRLQTYKSKIQLFVEGNNRPFLHQVFNE